jgi:hypothetical protein
MSGRGAVFVIEPDKWAFEAEEATVDEVRLRALLDRPDTSMNDDEALLALIDLLRDEVTERVAGEDGVLTTSQLALAFQTLFATARRLGWTNGTSTMSSASGQ